MEGFPFPSSFVTDLLAKCNSAWRPGLPRAPTPLWRLLGGAASEWSPGRVCPGPRTQDPDRGAEAGDGGLRGQQGSPRTLLSLVLDGLLAVKAQGRDTQLYIS